MTTLTSPPILVTGASTGIGHHLTRYLATHGHPVYATARKSQDLEALAESKKAGAPNGYGGQYLKAKSSLFQDTQRPIRAELT